MDSRRPGSGFFQHDVYKDLLYAMRADDENKFNQILNSENINVNRVYDKAPDIGTILDLCCQEGNRSKYIATLLSRGANPNLINSRSKKGPIHLIAMRGDVDSMRVLLENEETDPNLLDNFGATGLHYACKNNSFDLIEVILERSDVNTNIINRKGKSPMHMILDKEPSSEYVNVLNLLLSNPTLDLSLTDSDGVSLRQMIEESYPELIDSLPSTGLAAKSNVDASQLFQLLRRNNFRQFLNHVKGNQSILEGNEGSYTFLQYCCDYGIDDVVQALLDEGVNPNNTCSTNVWTPLMIACRKGFVTIVKMLVKCKKTSFEPVNNETILHCLVNGGYEKEGLAETNIERNHLKCLSYVLENVPPGRIDLNYRDKNGNTALHYAAKMGDQSIVLEILSAGAYIGICNKLNEPACSDIAHSTLERHLNNSVRKNDKKPRDEMYAVVFDYGCLMPYNKSERKRPPSASDNFIEVPVSSYGGKTLHRTGETDPLIYISQNNELRPLLTHPIFTSYLHLKWHKIKPYYFINLFFYVLFWLFLTYYILGVFVDSPTNHLSNTTINMDVNREKSPFDYLAWCGVFMLLLVFVIRETFQLLISPRKYVTNIENWLEIGIIFVTVLILSCGECDTVKHQIAAVGILASWAELVLLIGKHPSLSTNIEMLKTVSWTFFKFLAWYSILIVAFALCFFTLFKDGEEEDNQFHHPAVSIFKTIVMLTGEFDSGSIPFLLYPVTSHILFVLFVFLIAIVLFNLLNGLAVSDTQAIKADAELVGYISQAKLISHIEGKISKRFDCWGLLSKRLNFSNTINMFQNISDGKIMIYPNIGNKVEFDELSFTKNRAHDNDNGNCFDIKSIFMDSRIVRAAREILNNRELEKNQENYLAMVVEKENELRLLLNEFKDCLNEYKAVSARMNEQYPGSKY